MHRPATFSLPTLVFALTCWGTMNLERTEFLFAQDVAKIQAGIELIAKGDQADRQAIVCQMLEKANFQPELIPFQKRSLKGSNICVEVVPSDKTDTPWLVVGAHFDRVKKGQGVIDNGCGCIAIMELIQRLRDNPIPNLRVTAYFFDLEEVGLLGSDAIASSLESKPTLVMNIDVFAYGRQMWLNTLDENDAFTAAAKKVDVENALTFEHGKEYPPSDHLSFRKAKMEAVSFSLLPEAEVAEVEAMFKGERISPKILQTIHTAEDLPAKAIPQDMLEGIHFLEATLREWRAGLETK